MQMGVDSTFRTLGLSRSHSSLREGLPSEQGHGCQVWEFGYL